MFVLLSLDAALAWSAFGMIGAAIIPARRRWQRWTIRRRLFRLTQD